MEPQSGSRVEFRGNGDPREGYFAPAAGAGGPGVIVLQEWWGLVPHVEDLVRRFAAAGFTALAPDLYHGKSTTSPDEAGKLMMALDIDRTAAALGGAIRFLLAHPACTSKKVGTVGFCMGGQLSLLAACTFTTEVGAAVDFYGIHPAVKPDLARLQAPLLGFFAANDSSVPPERVDALRADLLRLGKQATLKVLPGTGHAFFNDTRPEVHAAQAARQCWDEMLRFFRDHVS
jgi:carboxymethylenebutenolidase